MNILRASVTGLCVLLCLVFATNARAQTYQHNIQALDFLNLRNGTYTYANISTPLLVDFRNTGRFTERHITCISAVTDQNGTIIQHDTITIDSIAPENHKKVSFAEFTPLKIGAYHTLVYCRLDSDEYRGDDTLRSTFKTTLEDDVVAKALLIPKDGAELLEKVEFHPTATFRFYGLKDVFEIPVVVEIRRCFDRALVFRADSVIPSLYLEDTSTLFSFPTYNEKYDLRTLSPGCYTIIAFVHYSRDGDRIDDTVRATFSIVPHQLANDVGVDSIYQPSVQYLHVGSVIPIKARFKNFGLASEQPAKVYSIVRDRHGKILYYDSCAIQALSPGEEETIGFKPYTATTAGLCYLAASISLSLDDFPENNSLQDTLCVGLPNDAKAIQIIEPIQDVIQHPHKGFRPKVLLIWQGLTSSSPLGNVRLEIHSCKNGALIYSDNAPVFLSYKSEIDTAYFQDRNDTLSTTDLLPGCYTMTAISQMPGDSNASNDTARTTFSIRGLHDITTDSILSPTPKNFYPTASILPFTARFSNWDSTNELKNIRLLLSVEDENNKLIFEKDSTIASWYSGETKEITFNTTALPHKGYYTVLAISRFPSDLVHSNDTIREHFYYGENLAVTQTPNASISLGQNFPNPATQKTTISYTLPKNGYVTLRLQDVLGRMTRIFTDGRFEQAGSHIETLALDGIPTGSYTYTLSFRDGGGGNSTTLAHQLGIIKGSY